MDNHKVAHAFGEVLRVFRKKRKLTQERLAFKCELDRSYISLLELGRQGPSLATIFAISKGLKINVGHLVTSVEEELQDGRLEQ